MNMENKFSKTPWIAGDNGYVYCDDALGSAVAKCDLEYTVAITGEQRKANAKLIAAAPELLEALELALTLLQNPSNEATNEDIKEIENAIKKATT